MNGTKKYRMAWLLFTIPLSIAIVWYFMTWDSPSVSNMLPISFNSYQLALMLFCYMVLFNSYILITVLCRSIKRINSFSVIKLLALAFSILFTIYAFFIILSVRIYRLNFFSVTAFFISSVLAFKIFLFLKRKQCENAGSLQALLKFLGAIYIFIFALILAVILCFNLNQGLSYLTNYIIMNNDYNKSSFKMDCLMSTEGKYPNLVLQIPLKTVAYVNAGGIDDSCFSKYSGACLKGDAGQYILPVIINLPNRSIGIECIMNVKKGVDITSNKISL